MYHVCKPIPAQRDDKARQHGYAAQCACCRSGADAEKVGSHSFRVGYKGCINGQIANVFESNRCCYDVLKGYIFINTMLHKTSFLLIFLIPFLLY